MRLNHELVRDIMLTIEKYQKPNDPIYGLDFLNLEEMKKHDEPTVIYHINRLEEAGYLNVTSMKFEFAINYITYDGDLFIDDIRDPKAWKYAKEKTKEFSSISLPMLAELGKQYVKNQLGL